MMFIDENKYHELIEIAMQESKVEQTDITHGEWLDTTKWRQGGNLWKKCSICSTLNHKSNYCPNCGAKMDL